MDSSSKGQNNIAKSHVHGAMHWSKHCMHLLIGIFPMTIGCDDIVKYIFPFTASFICCQISLGGYVIRVCCGRYSLEMEKLFNGFNTHCRFILGSWWNHQEHGFIVALNGAEPPEQPQIFFIILFLMGQCTCSQFGLTCLFLTSNCGRLK